MRYKYILTAMLLAASAAVPAAASVVIGFDDLPSGFGTVPDGYKGIIWNENFTYYTTDQDPYNPKSPPARVYGNYNKFPADAPAAIDFVVGSGSVFSGAWFAGLDVSRISFDLYNGATLVASSALLEPTDTPTFLASGYSGEVTRIVINTASNGYWVADDFTFAKLNAVPEPASWAMLIAGFGLTGATLRRRRSAVAA